MPPATRPRPSLPSRCRDVPLWWPVGYGEPATVRPHVDPRRRRTATADWTRGSGESASAPSSWTPSPDDDGTAFTLRSTAGRSSSRAPTGSPTTTSSPGSRRSGWRAAGPGVDANLNLLRIWGGGIYETEDFYDACDERGLLVWQDFLLACAAYPEEQPLWDEIEAEARENVARLTPHPSPGAVERRQREPLGLRGLGLAGAAAGRTWGAATTPSCFPTIVGRARPHPAVLRRQPVLARARRPVHPNDPDHGTIHTVGGVEPRRLHRVPRRDPAVLLGVRVPGPPAWATLRRARARRPLASPTKDDPNFLLHQKADDGNGKLDRGLRRTSACPDDFADWHWADAAQPGARGRRTASSTTARGGRVPPGAIVWQLNDCWPVTSWAAIDGDGRPQAALVRAAARLRGPAAHRAAAATGREVLAVDQRDPRASGRASCACRASVSTGPSSPRRTSRSPSGAWSVGQFTLPRRSRRPTTRPGGARRAARRAADGPHVGRGRRPRPGPGPAARRGHAGAGRLPRRRARDARWPATSRCSSTGSTRTRSPTPPSSTSRAGVTASFHVRTRGTFDPAALTRAPVLRSANDVVTPRVGARDLTQSPA